MYGILLNSTTSSLDSTSSDSCENDFEYEISSIKNYKFKVKYRLCCPYDNKRYVHKKASIQLSKDFFDIILDENSFVKHKYLHLFEYEYKCDNHEGNETHIYIPKKAFYPGK